MDIKKIQNVLLIQNRKLKRVGPKNVMVKFTYFYIQKINSENTLKNIKSGTRKLIQWIITF